VSVAACLLLFSFGVLAVGPPVLRRLTQTGDAPRLGVAAWMTAIASVLVSWAAATTFTLADVVHHWNHPGSVLAHCLATLRGLAAGNAGTALQLGMLILVGLGAEAVTISAARLMRMLMRMRNQTHGHASAVRLVGRRQAGLDAVVIDAPEAAAYCIAGRPHAVVITSAALATLTKPQLEAILAHERAHLDGRHPEIVAVARSLAKTFPRLRLMTEGAHHISRLLEMCADDAAAREHGRQPILDGILALTGATPVPSGALGAAGVAVLARAQRLADAPDVGLGRTALTAAVIAMTAGGPLAALLLAASGTLMCGL
jgi:beta-lactamase regulating signal transducer with metallopeptidase domain